MKKKILITGSSGFIGFHLAKLLLEKGIKIHGFDNMNNYYDSKIKYNNFVRVGGFLLF